MIDKCLNCLNYDNTSTYSDTGLCDLWKSKKIIKDNRRDIRNE